ncbi:MAG TPA: hypothetical protein VKQ70_03445 [Caulobacteraceae bacterium]|jgi:hypothetical protein|nr:hypothetical protein [Caulobacteraceae bacterium]
MIKHAFAALGFTAAIAFAAPALAFDTAPHANITEQAMAIAGYNLGAANVAQVENWLTDYYTSSPTRSGDKCDYEKLHFDDVFSDADVDAYWKTLLRNTRAAAAKAKADNDPIELYTVIGVSLHVVQDFYAHSNWVESSGYPGPGFDTTTYFQWRQKPWKRTDVIHTGWYPNCLNIPQGAHTPHGGYTSGMNHDSVVRPNYSRAYVYALSASLEWLQQIKQAVDAAPGDPTFATRTLSYNPPSAQALNFDQQASLFISEWVAVQGADGHWNGNHSGYGVAWGSFASYWVTSPSSIYVKSFKDRAVYKALSQGLYKPYVGADPPISPMAPLSGTVIDMHTAKVWANLTGMWSFFGRLTPIWAAGQGQPLTGEFSIRDAAQIHRPRTDVPWEYLTFARAWSPSVTLRYSVLDETGMPNPGEKLININGDAQAVDFVCDTRPGATCVWGSPPAAKQPMPASLGLKGNGARGVALSGVSVKLVSAEAWRP